MVWHGEHKTKIGLPVVLHNKDIQKNELFLRPVYTPFKPNPGSVSTFLKTSSPIPSDDC